MNTLSIENLIDSCKLCKNSTNCLKNKYLCPAFSLSMNYLATLLKIECKVGNVGVGGRIPEDFRSLISRSVQFKDVGGKLIPVGINLEPLLLDSVPGLVIAKELIRKISFMREGKDVHLVVSGVDDSLLLCTTLPLSEGWVGTIMCGKEWAGVDLTGKEVILLGCELNTGATLLSTAAGVGYNKGTVVGAVVVINRNAGGGVDNLKKKGIKVKCLMEANF